MKSFLSTIILLFSFIQCIHAFVVTPSSSRLIQQSERRTSELYFFFGGGGGNNSNNGSKSNSNNKDSKKKKSSTATTKNAAKVSTPKSTKKGDSQKEAWKQFGRILITGSPDGISLLGKPQHDWVTGSSLPQPKAHSWTSAYKKRDTKDKK